MAFSFANILEDNTGRIIISIILGLGLASLFKKVCHGRNCIVIKGPKPKELDNQIYKYEDKCYKYKAKQTKCSKDNNIKIVTDKDKEED